MRIKAVILAAAFVLVSCATIKPNLPELPPNTGRLALDGATFAAPEGGGWYVELRNPFHIGLVKPRTNLDETTVVEAQLFKLAQPVAGESFVQQIRQGEDQDTNPQRFTVRTHDVEAANMGNVICARSYYVTVDNAPHTASHSGRPMILEAASLKCRHPDDPRVGVSLTFSERYYPGDSDPDFKAKANQVLDSLELTKLKE